MGAKQIRLIESCPMCGGGPVAGRQRRGFPHREARSASCADCGATFVPQKPGLFQLAHCEPAQVAQVRGLTDSTACDGCHACLVGAALSVEEWNALVRAGGRGDVGNQQDGQDGQDKQDRVEGGEDSAPSTQHSAPRTQNPAVELEMGEEVRLEVGPVYMGEEIRGLESRAGRVVITNRRLLFLDDESVHPVALESITEVVESQPGLRVLRGPGFEPLYLFAPLTSDALHRIRQFLADGGAATKM